MQAALIITYMEKGATNAIARQLAASQIQPPKLSEKCERIRSTPEPPPVDWATTIRTEPVAKKQAFNRRRSQARAAGVSARHHARGQEDARPMGLRRRRGLRDHQARGLRTEADGRRNLQPLRGCGARGARFRAALPPRLHDQTGRLFVISDDPQVSGQHHRLGSFGTRHLPQQSRSGLLRGPAIGPSPPGEYSFSRPSRPIPRDLGTQDKAPRGGRST